MHAVCLGIADKIKKQLSVLYIFFLLVSSAKLFSDDVDRLFTVRHNKDKVLLLFRSPIATLVIHRKRKQP